MYICVYVYMYVCMYACKYICICIHIYKYKTGNKKQKVILPKNCKSLSL